MKFDIIPHIGASGINFGMDRHQVRQATNSPFDIFRRDESQSLSEHYYMIGIFAYYDERGYLEALEFSRPAEPIFAGIDLLALDVLQARAMFSAAGPILDDVDGPMSETLGIGVWAPDAKDDPMAEVEAAIAFSPKYYEKYPKEPLG